MLAVRAIVRKTWLAAVFVAFLAVLLGFGSGVHSGWGLLYDLALAMLPLLILRVSDFWRLS
jgi:hypothetical protein